jgi:hypothetical protein
LEFLNQKELKKRITLKYCLHKGAEWIALYFELDQDLTRAVRNIPGSCWSKTNRCWLAPCNKINFDQIKKITRSEYTLDYSGGAKRYTRETL